MSRKIECFAFGKYLTINREDDSRLLDRLKLQQDKCQESTGCPDECEVAKLIAKLSSSSRSTERKRSNQQKAVILLPDDFEILRKMIKEGRRFEENCVNCEKLVKKGSTTKEFDPATGLITVDTPSYERTCSAGGELRAINRPCEVPDEFELQQKLVDLLDKIL